MVEPVFGSSGRLAGDKDLDDLALTFVLGFAILRSSGEDCALPMINRRDMSELPHHANNIRVLLDNRAHV